MGSLVLGGTMAVPLHNPSDTSCVEIKNICGLKCKPASKSAFYVCKFGRHVICDSCQHNGLSLESTNDKNEIGDNVPEKGCTSNKKELLNIGHTGMKRQDLSSGDHSSVVDFYTNLEINNYQRSKSDLMPTSTPKERCSKRKTTTKVLYRNEKFHNDYSNITANYVCPMNTFDEGLTGESVPRPVACPIASCAKMVTIDSFSQHFNFDHSKVPRTILNRTDPQEILLNCASLSEEPKCVATFLISNGKRTSQTALRHIKSHTNIHNINKERHLLLLMAVKLPTRPVKFEMVKRHSRNSVNKRQTLVNENNLSNIKKDPDTTVRTNEVTNSEDDEVTILWLCKINDGSGIYTINVSRKDNQQGYSYIGDAVHIRNEQDPISVYASTECLAIRRTAINKLLTADNELKVIISTTQ